ncbi:hypothetical protein [Nostoc sp. FACHB-110]|uniref:hypothetical protein n=1 Tax=Nostoc sp. FACHB-110 TaxID=2692834 RepID=UPI0016820AAC|nr:hypothetical protein [Nostoc sp. FACHB-110]MBD2437601.1 hypothetical protein [Nostoc sp. FACHB-110]
MTRRSFLANASLSQARYRCANAIRGGCDARSDAQRFANAALTQARYRNSLWTRTRKGQNWIVAGHSYQASGQSHYITFTLYSALPIFA